MIGRSELLAALNRRQQTEPSAVFGGDLLLREITRAEWRTAYLAARTDADPETGEPQILTDVWHAHLFAVGVVGEDGTPLMSAAEVLAVPDRDGLPEEIGRIAKLILALSEQAPDSLKKKSES